MSAKVWTAEQSEMLRDMWSRGMSGTEIARKLGGGVTRNAVIGKIFRMGLTRDEAAVQASRRALGPKKDPPRKSPKRVQHATRTRRAVPKPRTNNLVAVNAEARRHSKPGSHYQRLRAAPLVDASLAKPWLERAFGECAYPITGEGADTFSCCQPAEPHGYCPAHANIMFRPFVEKPQSLQRLAKRFA